jgi:hypothetical protein
MSYIAGPGEYRTIYGTPQDLWTPSELGHPHDSADEYNRVFIITTTRPITAITADADVRQIGVTIDSEDGNWLFLPHDHPTRFADDPTGTEHILQADHAVYLAEQKPTDGVNRYRYFYSSTFEEERNGLITEIKCRSFWRTADDPATFTAETLCVPGISFDPAFVYQRVSTATILRTDLSFGACGNELLARYQLGANEPVHKVYPLLVPTRRHL